MSLTPDNQTKGKIYGPYEETCTRTSNIEQMLISGHPVKYRFYTIVYNEEVHTWVSSATHIQKTRSDIMVFNKNIINVKKIK